MKEQANNGSLRHRIAMRAISKSAAVCRDRSSAIAIIQQSSVDCKRWMKTELLDKRVNIQMIKYTLRTRLHDSSETLGYARYALPKGQYFTWKPTHLPANAQE